MDFEGTSQLDKSRIWINVGGFRHETHMSTLKNIPDTRLYWIAENHSTEGKLEYFYDRHPGAFTQILNYYRTGKLHYPTDMCGPMFEEELCFWGIDEKQMEPCCWAIYTKHREAEENLKAFVGPGFEDLKRNDLERSSSDISGLNEKKDNFWKRIQPKIWNIMDEPHSSKLAKVVSYLSCFFISLSIAAFCVSTLPGIRTEETIMGSPYWLSLLELVCSSFFTLEFLMRLVFCPTKLLFFKRPMNWIDLISILPFYVSQVSDDDKVKMFLVIRVLRLFRFVKLSYGLQIMIHTLKASSHELVLLLLILLIPVVMFSSIVYYIEIMIDNNSVFNSVPQSFWWCLITMTTVGYGDLTPQTWPGKIIGGACAVCGVLIVALPISVIGSNFSLYYAHAQARLKLPVKQHRLVLGGVPGLLTKHQELSSRRKKKSTAVPNHLDAEISFVTERTSLRSSMPHSPLLELRRATVRTVNDSHDDLLAEEDEERSVSSPLLKPSPQLCPRGLPEGSRGANFQAIPRRRPRRTSGTLAPRRALPDETGKEEEDLQQGGDPLSQQLLRTEQGAAELNSNSQVSEEIPASPNQTPIPGRQPMQNGDDQAGITPKNETYPLVPSGCFSKDNIRAKWFIEGSNCGKPKQSDPGGGEVLVNGAVNSTYFKRPSSDASSKSSAELDTGHLSPQEYTLKKRKSLSDSLLCAVPQEGEKLQSSYLPNGFSTQEGNVNNVQHNDIAKDKLSPSIDRKQNHLKQNGSPFSHKKPATSNGPCCKHSDEDMNNQRNRTSTHPCYDPAELPKRRRNAACTVAILSPGDRSGSDDFLETKI